MDILSITNKSSVSADAKVYTKDGNDFVTTTFDALYKNSSAKTNIEQSVSDVNARIDTTNNTVAELDNYARAKANGIVLHSQGEMVTVNDSSDDYVVNLKPYGKSEQDSTTGAQLLNYEAWKTVSTANGKSVFENNGVTITAIANDAYTDYSQTLKELFVEVTEGETVTLSWEEDTNASGLVYIFGNGWTDSKVNVNNSSFKKLSYTVPNGITFITFRFGVSFAGNTISYKNIMLNKGSTALPWEPYTGGQPSPNPDYPQEIRSTVISEIKTVWKNLLKNTATSQTINGVTFTVNDDGSVTANGTATNNADFPICNIFGSTEGIIPVGSYIVSKTGNSTNSDAIILFGTGKSRIGYTQAQDLSIDTDKPISWVILRISSGATVNFTYYPMIRKADITDPTYEPYTETVAQLSSPITLYGIPTDSDGNFTDSNGQQWIADYVDVDKGCVVRNVGNTDLSIAGGWYQATSWPNKECFQSNQLLSNAVPAENYNIIAKIMCNRLLIASPNSIALNIKNAIGQGSGKSLFVSIEGITTVDDLIAYFGENETIVHYPLATPTEEDLPTEDIVALRGLKTFYSVTNVTNDSEVKGEMVLSYNADTKMYIDNKFAELAAQLV